MYTLFNVYGILIIDQYSRYQAQKARALGPALQEVLEQGRHQANSCKKAWILLNFDEFTWIYLNLLEFAIFEKRVTHGRTDGPRTDKASYWVAFCN